MLPLCLGTFQQRDTSVLDKVVDVALDLGIRMFDTAPSYKTEVPLAEALHKALSAHSITRDVISIIDKIDGWQMQDGKIRDQVEYALMQMRIDYFDVLLVHWPFADYLVDTWKQLVCLKNEGKARKIGLCNVRCHHISELVQLTGVKPDYIQIERHPLWTSNDEIAFCRKNGINVMDYSPLCRMDKRLATAPILIELAEKYNKTISQIILRWHLDTGCIPVFMTKKPNRVAEHVNIFDFSLEADEIDSINSLDSHLKISLESWGCPGF